MQLIMRFTVFFLILASVAASTKAEHPRRGLWPARAHVGQAVPPAQPGKSAPSPPAEGSAASHAVLNANSSEAGYMDSAQLKAVFDKIHATVFRIDDLLTDVRPERWKISDAARNSFNQTLATLRAQMRALDEWRGQFENRNDSIYLGYQTYATIDAVLPRLNGVAESVGIHDSENFAGQYRQAADKLFDEQQSFGTYLEFLLRNQDQIVLALENNVAACQNQLGYAMRSSPERAKPMRNVAPVRPHRRSQRATGSSRAGDHGKSEKR